MGAMKGWKMCELVVTASMTSIILQRDITIITLMQSFALRLDYPIDLEPSRCRHRPDQCPHLHLAGGLVADHNDLMVLVSLIFDLVRNVLPNRLRLLFNTYS